MLCVPECDLYPRSSGESLAGLRRLAGHARCATTTLVRIDRAELAVRFGERATSGSQRVAPELGDKTHSLWLHRYRFRRRHEFRAGPRREFFGPLPFFEFFGMPLFLFAQGNCHQFWGRAAEIGGFEDPHFTRALGKFSGRRREDFEFARLRYFTVGVVGVDRELVATGLQAGDGEASRNEFFDRRKLAGRWWVPVGMRCTRGGSGGLARDPRRAAFGAVKVPVTASGSAGLEGDFPAIGDRIEFDLPRQLDPGRRSTVLRPQRTDRPAHETGCFRALPDRCGP